MALWADEADPSVNDYYIFWFSMFSLGYCIFVVIRSIILFTASFFTARKVH